MVIRLRITGVDLHEQIVHEDSFLYVFRNNTVGYARTVKEHLPIRGSKPKLKSPTVQPYVSIA